MKYFTVKHVPSGPNRLRSEKTLARCFLGENSESSVNACGTPPTANPVTNLRIRIQMKLGEKDERKP